jgi:hypothetical protein
MVIENEPETWVRLRPGVDLVSEAGPEFTFIEFCPQGAGIILEDCEGARVSGFTVRGVLDPACDPPMDPGSGIYSYNCTDVVVESCVIEQVSYGINVNGRSQEWWKPVFRNNTIRDCGSGIRCLDVLDTGRPYFKDNLISHCGRGAEIYDSAPYFDGCQITDCSGEGMYYVGSCGGDCWKCIIAHNEGVGVWIYSDPPLAAPSFNGSWLPEEANDFYDNGGWDIWYAYAHEQALVMATYNYWGTDCPDFASKIHGRVVYSPWVNSTHTVSLNEDDCPGAVEASTWGKIKAMFR